MYLIAGKTKYLIERVPSIFTSRNNKQDVYISRQCATHGRRIDGVLYECVQRLAAENGEILRNYATLPPEINNESLKQWGFLD